MKFTRLLEFPSTGALATFCRHALFAAKGTKPFRLAPEPRSIVLHADGVDGSVGVVVGGEEGSVGVVVGGVDGSVGVVVGGVLGSVGVVVGGATGALSFTIV